MRPQTPDELSMSGFNVLLHPTLNISSAEENGEAFPLAHHPYSKAPGMGQARGTSPLKQFLLLLPSYQKSFYPILLRKKKSQKKNCTHQILKLVVFAILEM